MKATEFKSVLSDLADLFRAGAAKTSAKDLDILADRIDGTRGKSADEALDIFEKELSEAAGPIPSPASYIRAFKEAGIDESAFQQVFRKFKNDRSIKKADALEVMRGYAGEHLRVRTKKDAIEEVERRFAQLVYDSSSHKRAASATPW